MRRNKVSLWIACFALLCGRIGHAEDSPALVALRQQLTSALFVLDDYSADAERKYQYEDGSLKSSPTIAHEFALFHTTKVDLHGSTLVIEGTRSFAVMIKETHQLAPTPAVRPMKLTIDLGKTTVDEALPKMRALLFKPSLQSAVDSVPTYMTHSVPAVWDQATKSYGQCDPCSDGAADQFSQSLVKPDPNTKAAPGQTKTQPPKVVHMVDPKIPDEAREQFKASGAAIDTNALVGMIVDTDGRPHELWLVHAAGYGLDEEAIKAVAQYKLDPAKRDGKPVPVQLNAVVNFRIF